MDEFADVAGNLLGCAVARVEPVRGGGNNRVFRVSSAAGRFVMKFYPPQAADRRDRLSQEYGALTFLAKGGIDVVPRPVARDDARSLAIYEWIEGRPIERADASVLDAMTALAARLAELSADADAARLPRASASCLAPEETIAQLAERLARIGQVAEDDEGLKAFLETRFRPLADRLVAAARDTLGQGGLDATAELAPGQRTLSPSDFGSHNALRGDDGKIWFIDFEYFGWDDPVKMVADTLWHAGMDLDAPGRDYLAAKMRDIFGSARDQSFDLRFKVLYPLYGLIWCLIVLNEFLPERWERRPHARSDVSKSEVLAIQLRRANALVDRLEMSQA